MSEFSLSFVIRQWWFVRVFTFLPYCIQYYVIHLCVHVIGELCWFITVYNAKSMKVGYQQGRFLLAFFRWKKVVWTYNCFVRVLAMSEFLRIYPIWYKIPQQTVKFQRYYIGATKSSQTRGSGWFKRVFFPMD